MNVFTAPTTVVTANIAVAIACPVVTTVVTCPVGNGTGTPAGARRLSLYDESQM